MDRTSWFYMVAFWFAVVAVTIFVNIKADEERSETRITTVCLAQLGTREFVVICPWDRVANSAP